MGRATVAGGGATALVGMLVGPESSKEWADKELRLDPHELNRGDSAAPSGGSVPAGRLLGGVAPSTS